MSALSALSLLSTIASQYPSQKPRQKPVPKATINTPNLCEKCGVRPKYTDAATGKTHSYCGKRCAATGSAPQQHTSTAAGTCIVCHSRPQHFDGTRIHPYCSKTCARKMKTSGPKQNPIPLVANGMCHVPGCNKAVHQTTNTSAKYCSQSHKSLAENACLWCRQAPKQGDRHFCGSACADEAQKKAVMLLEVPNDHVTFLSIADQFKSSWRHNSSCPAVKHVYKIIALQTSIDKYDAHKNAVESRGQFAAAGRPAGNENRRWHGTRRECTIGDNGKTQFCSSPTCSLCCIVKTSFDVSLWGKKTGWGRFGAGIYTSSTSSKANDYSQNDNLTTPLKAMLLNKVVVGKGFKMTRDDTSLTAPPAGYDSVLAEKGDRLNHDELVVYNNDAIRPSYVVLYEAP